MEKIKTLKLGSGNKITNNSLLNKNNLINLSIARKNNITDNELNKLKLISLEIDEDTNITDDGIDIPTLTNLKLYSSNIENITNDGLKYIKKIKILSSKKLNYEFKKLKNKYNNNLFI